MSWCSTFGIAPKTGYAETAKIVGDNNATLRKSNPAGSAIR